MNAWCEQIFFIPRDQLSMLPACWLENFQPDTSARVRRVRPAGLAGDQGRPARAEGFDDALYLELNPDLAGLTMDRASTIYCGARTKTGNTGASIWPTSPRHRFWCCGASSAGLSCATSEREKGAWRPLSFFKVFQASSCLV